MRLPIALGLPCSISVEPTTRCNLKCPECPTGSGLLRRRVGDMNYNRYVELIDQVQSHAITILLHFQGEPILNPEVFGMIGYATRKKLVTEMATNAQLIDRKVASLLVENGLKKIVVSIDSSKEEKYGIYRKGGSLQKVIEALNFIHEEKIKQRTDYPIVIVELLALSENITEVDDFVSFCKNHHADITRIKTLHLESINQPSVSIPTSSKYNRYKMSDDGKLTLKGNPNSACSSPWFKMSVTHDGWLVPCCFDKSATYIMGNMNHLSIKQAWFSKHFNLFRLRLLRNRKDMPVCFQCPQGRVKLDYRIY